MKIKVRYIYWKLQSQHQVKSIQFLTLFQHNFFITFFNVIPLFQLEGKKIHSILYGWQSVEYVIVTCTCFLICKDMKVKKKLFKSQAISNFSSLAFISPPHTMNWCTNKTFAFCCWCKKISRKVVDEGEKGKSFCALAPVLCERKCELKKLWNIKLKKFETAICVKSFAEFEMEFCRNISWKRESVTLIAILSLN